MRCFSSTPTSLFTSSFHSLSLFYIQIHRKFFLLFPFPLEILQGGKHSPKKKKTKNNGKWGNLSSFNWKFFLFTSHYAKKYHQKKSSFSLMLYRKMSDFLHSLPDVWKRFSTFGKEKSSQVCTGSKDDCQGMDKKRFTLLKKKHAIFE